jgi:hypothetical protein
MMPLPPSLVAYCLEDAYVNICAIWQTDVSERHDGAGIGTRALQDAISRPAGHSTATPKPQLTLLTLSKHWAATKLRLTTSTTSFFHFTFSAFMLARSYIRT